MATLDSDDRIFLEALLEPIKQTISRHERILMGNGQLGLVERVTQRDGTLGLHAARISDMEQKQHVHSPKQKVTLASLASVIAAIVAATVAALKP